MKYVFENKNFTHNNKFNTLSILISFVYEKEDGKNAYPSLISSIMNSSCEKYPSKKELYGKMYNLYNANLGFFVSNMYKNFSYNLGIEIINPKFVGDNGLLDETIDLAKEMLYKPLLNEDKNGFNEKVFEEKKRLTIDAIKNTYNDKSKYSVIKLLESMKKDGEYPITTALDYESIENIKNEDLFEFYKKIINKAKVYVYAYGDIAYDKLNEAIIKFNLETNDINLQLFEEKDFKIEKVNKIKENQNIKQDKLNLGYRTTISYNSKDYPSYVVFNQMFGGMFNSTLTTNIREKRSLVYSIYSNIIPDQKIFLISSGNDSNKTEDIINIIDEELKKYQSGEIENSEILLKMAKESIINETKECFDSQSRYLSQRIKDDLKGFRDINMFLEMIDKVTIEEVINASKTISLDTIYILGKDK